MGTSQTRTIGRSGTIRIRGARQNNLRNLDLDIKLNALTVITGVSGSGKSSLAFDTLYSEGQRLYVETFSAYTRQFLDRMDMPAVDKIEGIPPAIAIDQTNPVRTSRSTVGTMTEINDHLKLLFARAAVLFCRSCGREVKRDTPDSVAATLKTLHGRRVAITFPVPAAAHLADKAVEALVQSLGYRGVLLRDGEVCHVIQDRVRLPEVNSDRLMEDLEQALAHGHGRVSVWEIGVDGGPTVEHRFSSDLHCAPCDIHYRDPVPNLFSFNSPIGACETCRGFGRVIGIDYGLVVPNGTKTLLEGAVKPWQSKSYAECQRDMVSFAHRRGVPLDVPWDDLSDEDRAWVIEGEGDWDDGKWYGASRFFEWLEGRSYRMHIRVLLSRYRSYHTCPDCRGARIKPDALLWRVGGSGGRNLHELTLIPIGELAEFFSTLDPSTEEGPIAGPTALGEATAQLLDEIRRRLGYLNEVGLGYLNLDRQSRTLSGGEVQRVNLTTALGTSLVNTLFVLDEPSIGLHPRDVNRMVGVLHRLRDSGNTIVVVEHDPAVIMAADRIIDLGPAAGVAGGQIVFTGTPAGILRSRKSITGAYLSGRRSTQDEISSAGRESTKETDHRLLIIRGAREHNLKSIDVALPLHRIVALTGVSGSGKSTLMEDVLHRSLQRHLGQPTEQPGQADEIIGADLIDEVVLVDQSAIGKSARSNPASYVGAFDAIRKAFADTPLSKERGYSTGTFSFNSPKGQCRTCKGSGFEHIEMQFLSDVYLRCDECGGSRFRSEVLDVRLGGRSVADVLELTVDEAVTYFADQTKVVRALRPLISVGLGYVTLGQPVPTLSGGEAQRLKLASHLATTVRSDRHSLFLFDEPTTGLHFQDIATLIGAFESLVAAGHSVLVIEHNLDVVRAADWIIDLGPEGGQEGGQVIFTGTPLQLAEADTYTAAALKGAALSVPGGKAKRSTHPGMDTIELRGAREHNLKDIDLQIPHDKFTVLTGVSGSGKSTIAFDIVFAEGQRRYLESLNAYARQFVQPASRAELDDARGIPPSVAIEQRTSRGGQKSTVAISTEIYQYLRLLYAKMGTQYCPECQIPIQSQTADAMEISIREEYHGKSVLILSPLVLGRKGYYTDLAKRHRKQGHTHLRVDGQMTPTAVWPRLDRYKEHDIELPFGPIDLITQSASLSDVLEEALEYGNGVVYVIEPASEIEGHDSQRTYSSHYACPSCRRSFDELDPRFFSFNSSHGWCGACLGTGVSLAKSDRDEIAEAVVWDGLSSSDQICPDCAGGRLRPEAQAVRFRERSIVEFASLSIEKAYGEVLALRLTDREEAIARDIINEMANRLGFLREVGLGYLTLDRPAPTLSGGEAQRIRLAAQLGSNLRGVCYILDEPTIGLHPRDNQMLLGVLRRLTDKGNTVLVVEHDEDTIRAADYIVDVGPGGGIRGGSVVGTGTLRTLLANPASVTAQYLRDGRRTNGTLEVREDVAKNGDALRIVGARVHNLRGIDVTIPLRKLITVTGVSGSGKSSLVRDVLYESVHASLSVSRRKRSTAPPSAIRSDVCTEIRGIGRIERVLEVDQTPIGKTPRSTPATYIGVWDEVRRLYASLPEARMRGYTASRFSFNTAGGRCEVCGGQGVQRIEMSFLPDVTVLCEQCGGARYDDETLAIEFKGQSIADVLAMSVEEAAEFFSAQPKIHSALRLLNEVGLGYLTLGQRSPTLSGGEAQRMKLVAELSRSSATTGRLTRRGISAQDSGGEVALPSALYVLDEPTVGLHMADVDQLITVLKRLVETGATVVVIEHNLDLIAASDWVVDLGPEGGDGGGSVVVEGPVESIVAERSSHTGSFLARRFGE